MIGWGRRVSSRDVDGDGHIDIALLCCSRQGKIRTVTILDPGNALVELHALSVLEVAAVEKTYDQLDPVFAISLDQGLRKAPGAIALFGTSFFIEAD